MGAYTVYEWPYKQVLRWLSQRVCSSLIPSVYVGRPICSSGSLPLKP